MTNYLIRPRNLPLHVGGQIHGEIGPTYLNPIVCIWIESCRMERHDEIRRKISGM